MQYFHRVMWNSLLDPAHLVRRAAAHYRVLPAVSDGVRSLTYRELVSRAERIANALDGLVVPTGAVGILSENRAEYVEVDLGIVLARRVRVAFNPRLHLEDHRFSAADAEIGVLFHSASYMEEAAALAEEMGITAICFDSPGDKSLDYGAVIADAPDTPIDRPAELEDPAWITYTSGTTGRPKGILLSRRSIREVAFNLLLELGPVRPGDRVVLPQPLSHGAGYFVLPWLASGGELYVMRRFDAEEAWAVASPGTRSASTLKCVPAMVPALLEVDHGAHFGYDAVVYGAAPMPAPILDAALDRFGPKLIQIYGQSEAPMTLTCLHKQDHLRNGPERCSAGRPFRSVGLEIRDDDGRPLPPGTQGEVAVTGSHVMSGYHRLQDETAKVIRDGWVLTNDMGIVDEHGFLFLRGRRDEIINSGGFNISPREVEQAISTFPGVEEVIVVGLPDKRWGQAVTAMVTLRTGAAVSADELLAFVHPRLGFRTPRALRIVDRIPKNAYGKVNRKRVMTTLTGADGRER